MDVGKLDDGCFGMLFYDFKEVMNIVFDVVMI